MKTKYIILLNILITISIIVGVFFTLQYETQRNQVAYNQGYLSGLIYTQQSGNVALYDNGTLIEMPIQEICYNLNANQGGK